MKSTARNTLLVAGVLAEALGLVWIGRGTSWFVWPHDNFMAGQMTWAYRGVALVVIGALIAYGSRRI